MKSKLVIAVIVLAILVAVLPVQVQAAPSDIIALRSETSKTFDLGNGAKRLEVHMGAIHYKDNYADPKEQWKDIDLTWVGNKITKAPYELTLDDNKATIKDKKTGEISTIELTGVKPAGLKYEVIPEFSAVRFRHILPTDKIPFEAQFKVIGKGFLTHAFDDEGELELETGFVDGILTEKLSEVRDKQTGKIRPAKGNIRVDPTWQVGASSDDCRYLKVSGFSTVSPYFFVGCSGSGADVWAASAARFLNVNIPAGATITSANLKLTASILGNTLTVVNTRLRCEKNTNPLTFSDATDFDARLWTTAYMNWDAIPAWTLNTEYTSPSDDGTRYFKDIIQEVVNLGAITHLVVLWDDFEQRSTQVSNTLRSGYSYDGSTTYAPKMVIDYTLPPSTVTTSAASGITYNSFTATGAITDTGGENASLVGFEWGLSSGNYTDNATTAGDYGVGEFTKLMSGLTPVTEYFFRAMAYNSGGWGYGSEESCKTLVAPPAGFALTSVLDNQVNASWDTSFGATGYLLLVSLDDYPSNPLGENHIAYSGNDTSVNLTGYNLLLSRYYFSLWTEGNSYSSEYATGEIGGEQMAGIVEQLEGFNTLFVLIISLLPIAIFTILAFWQKEMILFLVSGIIIIVLAVLWIDDYPGVTMALWGLGVYQIFKAIVMIYEGSGPARGWSQLKGWFGKGRRSE